MEDADRNEKAPDAPSIDSDSEEVLSLSRVQRSLSKSKQNEKDKAETAVDPLELQSKLENLQISSNTDQVQDVNMDKDKGGEEMEKDEDDQEVAAISEDATRLRESEQHKSKEKEKKRSLGLPTKVVFRNLPPTLHPNEFLEIVRPDEEDFDYFHYTFVDKHYGRDAVAAAYLNCLEPEVADLYIERFHQYVVIDQRGYEYPMEVDYAISQTVPKFSQQVDPLMGTIEQTEVFQKFAAMYKDSPDGIIGVLPLFNDAKAMSEHVLKEIEEKEENKGKLPSTPLLDSIREKLKNHRLRQAKEREEQIKKQKERERLKALKKEARRQKKEQQKQERKEREKREKEKREKERRDRERKLKEEKAKQKSARDNKTDKAKTETNQPKTEKVDSTTVDKNKEKEQSAKKTDGPAVEDTKSKQPIKDEQVEQVPSTSSSRKYSGPRDRDQDYVPRRSYNDRRNRPDRRQGQDKEKGWDSKKQHDRDRNRGGGGPVKKPAQTKPESTESVPKGNDSASTQPAPSTSGSDTKITKSSSETSTNAKTETTSTDKEKPKKVVKKVVKVIRVKSSDGVPVEGKVIDKKKVIKKTDENGKKDNVAVTEAKESTSGTSANAGNKSESKTAASESKGNSTASASGGGDRHKKGRPDIQIYRPGSWRHKGSGGSNKQQSSSTSNTKISTTDTKSEEKTENTTTKAKEGTSAADS